MMLPKEESNSSSGRFLQDIENISKRLNLHRISFDNVATSTHQRTKSNIVTGDLSCEDKKSSIWKKPWKALSHIRSRQFDCWFFLHVHSIEGLPSEFNDTNIRVYWKRKDKEMRTRPAKVSQGKAQFEETLMHQGSVYCSRTHHKYAKYEPKIFSLYALVMEATVVDMGKHQIDLTKLLPLTLEELDDARCSGKWTSGFKLSGRAEGGVLNVSFGFSVRRENFLELGNSSVVPMLLRDNKSNIRVDAVEVARDGDSGRLRVGSSRSNSKRYLLIQSQSGDSNILGKNSNADVDVVRGSGRLPRVGSSASTSRPYLLISHPFDSRIGSQVVSKRELELDRSKCVDHGKVEEANMGSSHKSSCDNVGKDSIDTNATISEQKIDMPSEAPLVSKGETSGPESIDVREIFGDDVIVLGDDKGCALKDETSSDNNASGDTNHKQNDIESIEVRGVYDENEIDSDEWTGFNPMGEDYTNKIDQVLTLENPKVEIIDVNDIFKDDEVSVDNKSVINITEQDNCTNEDYPAIGITKYEENNRSTEELATEKMILDDITDSVANEFLSGLVIEQNPLDQGADSEPESPRERLLRQFEASGGLSLNLDSEEENVVIMGDDLQLSLVVRVNDNEDGINNFAQSLRIKKDAELLEYTETEALMKEWGFNEDVFQNSPGSSGFGSPVYLPIEEPVAYPSLGEGLGSTVRTKDGGFLRSMNPLLFKNAKNGGNLIMQVSAPVVLPAAMGSSIMEILQHWASVGCDKMCMQVDELMPLEDISGKMLQQFAWEIASRSEATERLPYFQQESEVGHGFMGLKSKVKGTPFSWGCEDSTSTLLCDGMDIDYVSFNGLASLAMDKVEALLIEGLRIQSGMANEEAPSILEPQPLEEKSAFLGKSVVPDGSLMLEDVNGSEASDDVDELISLSLKLDEWMRLDAGIFGNEDDEMSERISKVMEVHLNGNMEFDSPTLIQDKSTGKNCGLLGNNFTVAIRVQLRDPLRDYETVGTSMVSLVEVERVFLDPKPLIHCRVSEGDDNDGNYTISKLVREDSDAEEEQTIMEEAAPLIHCRVSEGDDTISDQVREDSNAEEKQAIKEEATPLIHCRVSEGDDNEDNYTISDQVREDSYAEEKQAIMEEATPLIHCRVSEGDDNEGNYTISEQVREDSNDEEKHNVMEEATPLFKITEVHVAGFGIEAFRKQNRGATCQEHSGFRWLLASGMGEMKKHIQLKTNAIVRSHSAGARKTEPRDTLWSISSHVHSSGAKWKELATSNVYIRNPDVIFLN